MKISIVTPVLNGNRYISETIASVITQRGNFSIEYIIVDGLSRDGTVATVAYYQKLMADKRWPLQCKSVTLKFISEPDIGIYDGVNKGFAAATGDIFAYINSDDIYLPGAFQQIVNVFQWNKRIRWLKGISSFIDEDSAIRTFGEPYLYDRRMIRKGAYGRYTYFIQQDSVFWKRDLWDQCGPIDTKHSLAGDFYLWRRFARITRLYTLAKYVSCFRIVKGQLSTDSNKYRKECNDITPVDGLLRLRYMVYHHFQYRLPKGIARIASLLLLGDQDLNTIVIHKNKILLRKSKFYA